MRDLIPVPYPANSWKGFALRVATIAIAALIVLGAVDLFEYITDSHTPRHIDTTSHQPTQPMPDSNP